LRLAWLKRIFSENVCGNIISHIFWLNQENFSFSTATLTLTITPSILCFIPNFQSDGQSFVKTLRQLRIGVTLYGTTKKSVSTVPKSSTKTFLIML